MLGEDKLKILRKLRIASGGHSHLTQDEVADHNKQVCIMEAINYVQHGIIDDAPPCVSYTIVGLMIDRNDTITNDKERNKLKKLAPEIVHTAPTKRAKGGRVVTAMGNKRYKAAEAKRQAIEVAFREKAVGKDSYGYDCYRDPATCSVREFNKLIRELAAVAKFEA